MKRDSQELLVRERFVAGSLAGAISQSAIYPMEVYYIIVIFALKICDLHSVRDCSHINCISDNHYSNFSLTFTEILMTESNKF